MEKEKKALKSLPEKEFFTPNEAAQWLGMCFNTFTQFALSNKLPFITPAGLGEKRPKRYYSIDAIRKVMKQNTVTPQ